MKRAWPRGWFVFTAATVARFWACVDKAGGEDACWLFAGPLHPQGYGLVTFEGEPMGAHRMSCILAHGQPPRTRAHASRLALHSCDNPPCVNPRHLRWGSPRENTQEMLTRGRGVHQRKLRERLALAGAAAS